MKIFIYLRIYYLAIKSIFKLNLGDIVKYKEKKFVLTQGVCNPYWNIQEYIKCCFEDPLLRANFYENIKLKYLENIHKNKFKKELSIRNIIHDIKFTYNFYKGYWFDIWYRKILENKKRFYRIFFVDHNNYDILSIK